MPPINRKLRLAGALAALLTLSLAISCRGFFQNPTVSTITIDPPSPTVAFGSGASSLQLTAAATYNDGSSGTLSGGTSCTGNSVCWSSSDTTVATITSGGLLTGVSAGTTTITAASGSITGTTTATAAETVSSMTISPTTASIPADGETLVNFTIEGVTSSGQQNISSLVTLNLELSGTDEPNIVTCSPSTDSNGNSVQSCTAAVDSVTTQTTYSLVVAYSGYTGTAQVAATLTVTVP
jgi:trimeric autotransporter adhesin